jgi:hypothetical protein
VLAGHGCGDGVDLVYVQARKIARDQLESRPDICGGECIRRSCSGTDLQGISESDRMVMPSGAAIDDSVVLTPLMYYKLTVPVVPLPRSLNDEAMRVGSRFLEDATQQHERFLAMPLSILTEPSNGYPITP